MSTSKRSASRTRFYQSQWKTDPTFYPTAKLAMEGPVERYAYVAALAPDQKSRSDALLVVDLDPTSDSYGKVAGRIDLPDIDDELHHFGWNACSSALCPYAPHPHVERRYLIVPGIAIFPHSHYRHQAGSTKARNRENHRAAGSL